MSEIETNVSLPPMKFNIGDITKYKNEQEPYYEIIKYINDTWCLYIDMDSELSSDTTIWEYEEKRDLITNIFRTKKKNKKIIDEE